MSAEVVPGWFQIATDVDPDGTTVPLREGSDAPPCPAQLWCPRTSEVFDVEIVERIADHLEMTVKRRTGCVHTETAVPYRSFILPWEGPPKGLHDARFYRNDWIGVVVEPEES